MNIPALRWILLAACVAAVAAAAGSYEDEYEDEEAPAPAPPVKASLRPSPLTRQARGPIVPGRPSPKNVVTQKTTSTEAPAEYEDEEGEGDEPAGGEDSDQNTTSEAPKRGGVRAGGVRPFRSNADLLETLKKRRQQHVSGHHAAPATTSSSTSAPPAHQEKGFKAGNRRPGKPSNSVADQRGSNSEPKPTFNRSNGRLRSPAPSPTEAAADQPEEQPRTRGFRSRKF